MPRTKGSGTTGSAFRQVQQQARSLLIQLRKEIRDREAELTRLKDEEETLDRLTGEHGASQVRVAVGRRTSAAGAGRINWRTVLNQLPKQFKASNIRGDIRSDHTLDRSRIGQAQGSRYLRKSVASALIGRALFM